MAFSSGNVAIFRMDSTAGGALTDISAYISKVTFPFERKSTDLPRLGGNATAKLTGPVNGTISLEGWYDPTIENIFRTAMTEATAVSRSYEYSQQGSATGLLYNTGEVLVTSYEDETGAEDPATWKAELTIDGANTLGTY